MHRLLPLLFLFAQCGTPSETRPITTTLPNDTSDNKRFTLERLEQLDLETSSEQADQQPRQDLNYDGHADYVLYGQSEASTGQPYWAEVYMYQPVTNDFVQDTLIGFLPNPGFFLAKHKINSFYIGLGAGEGSQYEWIDQHWIETRHFSVFAGKEIYASWRVRDVRKGITRILRLPYQMVPPKQVLEN